MSIHERIKEARLKLGLSHEAVARAVSKLEKSPKDLAWQSVQQWENGASAPRRKRLEHVAIVLKTTPQALLYGESEAAASEPTAPVDAEVSLLTRLVAAYAAMTQAERESLLASAEQALSARNVGIDRFGLRHFTITAPATNQPAADADKQGSESHQTTSQAREQT